MAEWPERRKTPGRKPGRNDIGCNGIHPCRNEKEKRVRCSQEKATAGVVFHSPISSSAQKKKIAIIAPKRDSSGKTAGTVKKEELMPRMKKE